MYIEKKQQIAFNNQQLNQKVGDLLAASERAIREGNSQYAYDLSLQATQLAPENLDAWLLRATLAPSLEERLLCVNHLNELAPGYQDRYHVAFFALKELLDRSPFLAYLEETDGLYRVLNADRVVLSIPKKRAPVEPYPPEEPARGPLQTAYRWLTLSLVGLLLAGIGTIVFAPLAALSAFRAHRSVDTHPERVSSTVVLVVAVLLFMIGVIFSILFLLHWLG